MSIKILPEEITERILSFATDNGQNRQDVVTYSVTCKLWQRILSGNPFWQSCYLQIKRRVSCEKIPINENCHTLQTKARYIFFQSLVKPLIQKLEQARFKIECCGSKKRAHHLEDKWSILRKDATFTLEYFLLQGRMDICFHLLLLKPIFKSQYVLKRLEECIHLPDIQWILELFILSKVDLSQVFDLFKDPRQLVHMVMHPLLNEVTPQKWGEAGLDLGDLILRSYQIDFRESLAYPGALFRFISQGVSDWKNKENFCQKLQCKDFSLIKEEYEEKELIEIFACFIQKAPSSCLVARTTAHTHLYDYIGQYQAKFGKDLTQKFKDIVNQKK